MNDKRSREQWKILSPIFLLLIWMTMAPVASMSATWTIKPDGTGDAPDLPAVMDSLAAGDSIMVDSGHYFLTTFLSTPFELSDIAIIGINGAGNTILDFSGTDFGLIVDSFRCLVKGLTFQNAAQACVILDWCSESKVEYCVIRNGGHGISIDMAGASEVSNNLIYDNDIGIFMTDWAGSITIVNNTIAFHDGVEGQAISFEPSSGGHLVARNIFCNNTSISRWGPASATFECNDLFNNDDDDIATVTFVDCLYLDPQFCGVDPRASGNFHLQADSPCCISNSPTCGRIGAFGVGCDQVGIESRSWGRIKRLR